MPFVVYAPAKLNLFLHVLGRRADGYHLIESGVVFTELADVIEIAPAEALSLRVVGPFAEAAGGGEGNLVLRAARALQQAACIAAGAAITLNKHIPVGAGLGGGSADAAAVLRGLNDVWGAGLSQEALCALAPSLGADVAMCVASRACLARGVGELLSPWAIPAVPGYALLVHPRVPLLTASVYSALAAHGLPVQKAGAVPQGATDVAAWTQALSACRNDLEPAACAVLADLVQVRAAMAALVPAPALVRMTGSGACCFALYATQEAASLAQETLMQAHPHWWSCVTAIRHE